MILVLTFFFIISPILVHTCMYYITLRMYSQKAGIAHETLHLRLVVTFSCFFFFFFFFVTDWLEKSNIVFRYPASPHISIPLTYCIVGFFLKQTGTGYSRGTQIKLTPAGWVGHWHFRRYFTNMGMQDMHTSCLMN